MPIHHHEKAGGRTRGALGLLILIAACLGCSGPAAMIYPDDSPIQRLARELNFEARRERAAIERQSALYREPQIEHLIQQLLETLISGEPTQDSMPQVILVKDTALKAYSFPDGTIYVHTGLLARLEHEAELALLLSHELVHIIRQHALQVAMLEQKTVHSPFSNREVSDSLSWSYGTPAPLVLEGASNPLQTLRRQLEEEADRMGLDMLIKAHYDPNEAFEIFEHLKSARGPEESRERAGSMLRMLAAAAPVTVGRPSDPKTFGRSLYPLLMAQAELEIQRGRWDPALQCIQRLFREDPENARGHYLLGELYRQRAESGDVQRALIHYDRAIASAPSFPEPRRAAGLLYFKQGNARRARAFFQSAIELSPQLRGNAYIRGYLTQCSSIEGENP